MNWARFIMVLGMAWFSLATMFVIYESMKARSLAGKRDDRLIVWFSGLVALITALYVAHAP